jgi:hypothetical protein
VDADELNKRNKKQQEKDKNLPIKKQAFVPSKGHDEDKKAAQKKAPVVSDSSSVLNTFLILYRTMIPMIPKM